MDTKHLEYFRIVYETKSIHAAAKKLFISAQGLGKIIQNIEAEFGTVLFSRTKDGVFPTSSGTIFYEQCVKTEHELKLLRSRMTLLAHEKHSLKIGFATGTLQLFPLEILFHFIEDHPNIQVQWCEYHNPLLVEQLLSADVDYAFIVGKTHPDLLVQNLCNVCPVVLLVYEGHPLYGAETVSLDMLRDEKLILMNEEFQIYHDFVTACRLHGFKPNVIAKTMDGATLYRLSAAKLGLSVSPRFPGQFFTNLRAIPLVGDYNWEIYGSYLKEQDNNESVRLLDSYLEDKLSNQVSGTFTQY